MINIRTLEFYIILFCIFCLGFAAGGTVIKLMNGIPI